MSAVKPADRIRLPVRINCRKQIDRRTYRDKMRKRKEKKEKWNDR